MLHRLINSKFLVSGADWKQYLLTSNSRKKPHKHLHSRICNYYLSCISEEGLQFSTLSRGKKLKYFELERPSSGIKTLNDNQEFKKFREDNKQLGAQRTLYFGYPTCLHSGKEYTNHLMVEPLFLFKIEYNSLTEKFDINLSYPIVNISAVSKYTNDLRELAEKESVRIIEELDLNREISSTELDSIYIKLREIRPKWVYAGSSEPQQEKTSLSETIKEGVHDRAVILDSEQSPYTQGLEAELDELARLSEDDLSDTVLGKWIYGNELGEKDSINSSLQNKVKKVIEILPMNLEQRVAINYALTKELTVITGPPGTGKSQVVSNLLINSAWSGQRVLLASKNNKAVDVVEERINNLGSRPILLRVGSIAHRAKLAEFLVGLMSTHASASECERFRKCVNLHCQLQTYIKETEQQLEQLAELRNSVDKLEQLVESFRLSVEKSFFTSLKHLDLAKVEVPSEYFSLLFDKTDIDRQNFLVRFFWSYLKTDRLQNANNYLPCFARACTKIGLSLPSSSISWLNWIKWKDFQTDFVMRLHKIGQVKKYFEELKKLQDCSTISQIVAKQIHLYREVEKNSLLIWELWLKVQPGTVKQEDRALLNQYSSLLKLIIAQGSNYEHGKSYWEYKTLAKKVSHLLPCWAVTSLSAKNNIAFEAGHFDLVIFDEASQCDIPSALPLLYRAKAAVIIGDPKQLPHISRITEKKDLQTLEEFYLTRKSANWAYSCNSLFDLASGLVKPGNIINLLNHYRSHADIIDFSNEQFYGERLRIATKYDRLKVAYPTRPHVYWVNIKGYTTRPKAGSAFNTTEVNAIIKELRDLVLNRKYSGSVGVISPFRAQANAVRQAILRDTELFCALNKINCLVDTIHKFQGDERDIIFFSPVISENMNKNCLEFLRRTPNIFNVAITRARAQLIVVGDQSASIKSNIKHLKNFALYSMKLLQNQVTNRGHEADAKLSSLYPPVANPEAVSDWERILYVELFKNGVKTLPQFQADKFIIDLAIVENDRKIAIEVDGEAYHKDWDGELLYRDQLRNQRLQELGWKVIRFWVYEVRDDISGCIEKVKSLLL